jgi:hypothetical protein
MKRWISRDGTQHLTKSGARLHSEQLGAAVPLQRAAPPLNGTMRLWGAIQKIEPQDDGTIKVFGIASSETLDQDGEIVRADAIRAALPAYMKFGNIREMHQLSAAGTTIEAAVGDDNVTRIVTHIVDPVAVLKVKSQVYKGFSIGGRVTQRDSSDPKIITGVALNEISLVDRPANPEAIFDCWKAAAADQERDMTEPNVRNDETLAWFERDLRQLQGDPAMAAKRRAEDDARSARPIPGAEAFVAAVRQQRSLATARSKQPADRYGFERWFQERAG